MADGRHNENRFLAISQRFTVVRRSRITLRHRLRDKKYSGSRHLHRGNKTANKNV